MYINDLTVNLKCNIKLFADDTSLFTIAYDPNEAATDMNHDFDIIKIWAHQQCMLFNPNPMEQAVEIAFSTKKNPIYHLSLEFNNAPVIKVDKHKHLGMILDSKMSFASHIHTVIFKC